MQTFLWTFLVFRVLAIAIDLSFLGRGVLPKVQTRGGLAVCVFLRGIWIVWAIVLLIEGA